MGFDLDRFKKAQEEDYPYALQEIKAGRKRSHWIWYIFPQLKGLGFSSMSEYYGIDGRAEAQAYIADSVLRAHLVEISEALLALESNNPTQVMGYPDELKLKSCMTLFAEVAPDIPVFEQVLQKFFAGEKDSKTLQLLR